MRWPATLILAAIALLRPAAAQEQSLELAVKAAYLVKFEPFVTWPAKAFPDPAAPFTLCVAEPDPFGSLLDRAAEGLQADGRPVKIRRVKNAEETAGCRILYLDRSETRLTPAALRGRPVLTVTDAAEEEARGIIDFRVIDGRVRFSIDDEAAAESGIEISSKLLSLAVSVRHRGVKE